MIRYLRTSDAALDITGPFSATIWIRPGTEGNVETAPLAKADSGAGWSWQLRYGWGAGGKPTIMGWQFNTTGTRVWVWVQEEPANMGVWPYLRYRFGEKLLGEVFGRFCVGFVIETQQVQGPVHDHMGPVVFNRLALLAGLCRHHGRTHDDIAEQLRRFRRQPLDVAGRKRQHIGRRVFLSIEPVQSADLVSIDDPHRDIRVPCGRPARLADRRGNPGLECRSRRYVRVFAGDLHVSCHGHRCRPLRRPRRCAARAGGARRPSAKNR